MFNSTINAQDFSLEILDAKGDFGMEERQGFVTKFDLPYQAVKKEWWRYVRRFAMISNKKTHYENRILAKRSGAASDIFFLSFLDRDGDDSYIYAALRKDSEDGDNAKVFKKYLRDLILDFKVAFYSEYMQEQIENKEKEASRLSAKLEKLESMNLKLEASKKKKNAKPDQIEERISANKEEVEKLRIELFAYQKNIGSLKDKLQSIK